MKFVFDLDGTICFNGQPVTRGILHALLALTEAGHEVIFASARPIRDMLPVINKDFHHYTMIGGNGALISKEGEIIRTHAFSANEIRAIKYLIERYEATYLIDGAWDYAYTGPDNHAILQNLDPDRLAKSVNLEDLHSIVKVLLLTANDMGKLAEELSNMSVYMHMHSKENILDISPSGINKWSALEALGVKEHTYIAFGNDANDLSMFEHALHTVMIGNHEKLAGLAKETIKLNGDYEQEITDKIRMLSAAYILQ